MLTQEDNELITRVGPGTPMGNLLRQYWIPGAMSKELPAPDGVPLRMRLLGENLIAFRTTSGAVGVIADACPHRGASMFFGRNEEEGLRCVYHGWKFDTTGACVDMPSEPAESNFREKVKATAYKTRERGGLLWVYMGPRENPPELPEIEANMLPEGEYFLGAFFSECNWLQSLEGDFDTIHTGFLHRGGIRIDSVPEGSIDYYTMKTRWSYFVTVDTEVGATNYSHRPAGDDTTLWRLAQYMFPFYGMTPTQALGARRSAIAVVPMDDEHTIRFDMTDLHKPDFGAGGSVAAGVTSPVHEGRNTGYTNSTEFNTTDWLGRFNPPGNRRNDYLIDRDLQKSNKGNLGYSGIPGRGQDGAVTESMGIVYQRNQEHLGVTDSGIIRMRRLLINHTKALRDHGTLPPGIDNPRAYRIRSGSIVLPKAVDGIDGTKELQWRGLTEAPQLEARA